MRGLTYVRIQGLLGQFTHEFDFSKSEKFIVIHGPNGVGKTKMLELIEATFKFDFVKLIAIPFNRIDIRFDDDVALVVEKSDDGNANIEEAFDFQSFDWPTISYRLISEEDGLQEWDFSSKMAGELPHLFHNDEIVYDYEFTMVTEMAKRRVSPRSLSHPWTHSRALRGLAHELVPKWLSSFLKTVNVHLIETQRLLVLDRAASSSDKSERADRRNKVEEFAADLSREISAALTRNSRTSQQLDGTFPRRVLDTGSLEPLVTDQEIRRRYDEQTQLRESLNGISILDDQEDLPLPGGALDTWQRRVLWIYLDDTDRKLATFQDLLDRIKLLQEIVNGRFLNKELVIDRERGFIFRTDGGRDLLASQLSSGEQHELVLVYDLLFNVKKNTTVLVDEPEISLHIAWQQKFLEDIQKIAEISSLRFIVATHSPQIIHKWWDRAVKLGPGIGSEGFSPR